MPLKSILSGLFAFGQTRQKLIKTSQELNKYRLVLDQAPAAVYIINKNLHFEYINPSFTKQSGYTKHDLINKHITQTIYKGEIPESRRHIVEALNRGETWQGELLTTHKLGSTYWASTIASPYKNNKNEVEGFIIIQQDITDHKKMELALNESENLYRSLIENSLDGMVITQDFKFLFTNKVFEEMIGYTFSELTNMDPLSIILPNDRERLIQKHHQRMSGAVGSQKYNAGFIRKNGSTFEAELNAANVIINGKLASFITMRDITERENLNNALRESETKYKALVENSQDGISIVRDNRYLFANKTFCQMLGYSLNELLEMPAHNSIHPNDREKAAELANRRRNLDFSTINEFFRMLTKSGEIRECESSSTMIEYGGVYASFFTVHDITESKLMQLELKQSEEKYRHLVETTNSIILKWDKNFRITFLNEYGLTFFGFTQNEIFSNSMVGTIVPPSEAYTGRNLAHLMNEIFNNPELYAQNENENIRKNGERVWIAWNNTPVRNKQGETIGMYSIGIDITERKNIQKALADSEEKYRSLIEKAMDGIVITQLGNFKFVNKAFCDMMQYTYNELIDTPYLNVVHPHYRELMLSYHNRRMNGENFNTIYRSQLIRKDGKAITVEINARTSELNGKPAGFIITRDITDRLKIEEELQTAKLNLELLNNDLEKRVKESSESLTEARTQLINLQKENIQSQFDVLRQQVNPHFLFNSLNVLTSLIKLEPDLAEKFSEHLSKVYRYVLENKDKELVDLKTELNFLDAYIFLLNIRFVDKLKVNVNIPQSKYNDQIIPLAMQLLIENAIKHNVMSKAMPLTINIFIDSYNFLNIINNLNERPSQLISTGVGLKNIQSRYLLLNNTQPVFEKTETQFIAKVPLIQIEY